MCTIKWCASLKTLSSYSCPSAQYCHADGTDLDARGDSEGKDLDARGEGCGGGRPSGDSGGTGPAFCISQDGRWRWMKSSLAPQPRMCIEGRRKCHKNIFYTLYTAVVSFFFRARTAVSVFRGKTYLVGFPTGKTY